MNKTLSKNNYLGIFSQRGEAHLYSHSQKGRQDYYFVDTSTSGFKFESGRKNFFITRDDGAIEKMANCSNFRISPISEGKYGIFYKTKGPKSQLYFATSSNISGFLGAKKVTDFNECAMLIPEYKFKDKYVAYFGESDIYMATSDDLTTWEVTKEPVVGRRQDNFDSNNLMVGDVSLREDGLLLTYFSKREDSGKWFMGTALFDKENPGNLIYRCREALWGEDQSQVEKSISPVGIILLDERLIVYFSTSEGKLYAFSLKFFKQSPAFSKAFPPYLIKKFKDNPIIRPLLHHFWESKQTFNPAAIYEGGKVHLLYRAVGDNDSSVLGYAGSSDGLNIDDRHPDPVYVPTEPFECSEPGQKVFNIPYLSGGGGNGGCEDPKLTAIDDKIYMTYVAFSGRSYPGVALTSIKKEDFLAHKWNWEKPVLISHPNEMHKNWLLFPEKINGKYAILHNLSPNVSIEYLDDLADLDGNKHIKSWDPHNYWGKNHLRHYWDSHVRGPGPPPLKTKLGWLLLYHAMDYRDYDRYKVGAMILDYKEPSNILYRSRSPVMEPDRHYENEGYKAGVVYAGGAVVKDDDLLIYYGGADKYACVAKANLEEFLDEVKRSEVPQVSSIKFKAY